MIRQRIVGGRSMNISWQQLQALARKIRPMRRFAMGARGLFPHHNGFLYYINPEDKRHDSLFETKPVNKVRRALHLLYSNTMSFPETKRRKFHPTHIAVLTQIPQEILRRVVAFEILEGSQDFPIVCVTSKDSFNTNQLWRAMVFLYARPCVRKVRQDNIEKQIPGFAPQLTNYHCRPGRLFR